MFYTTDANGVYAGPVDAGPLDRIPPRSTTVAPPEGDGFAQWDGATWVLLEYYPGTSPAEIAAAESTAFAKAKIDKNQQINEWRAQANQTHFTHTGKQIACDALSRSDIDAVAGSISLTGAFPVGFPGAWKAMDNSYIMLPDTDAFKAMYSSMTLQGTVNFSHSQTLKTTLAAATTVEQVNAVTWS